MSQSKKRKAEILISDLSVVFESFLPQLLTYPNPRDPLNGYAATMFLNNPSKFKKKVIKYVRTYATEEKIRKEKRKCIRKSENSQIKGSSDSEDSLSDLSENEYMES